MGRTPRAMTFDGEAVWVASESDKTVTRLSLDGTALGTYPVGGLPSALAFDGEDIWVTNMDDSTVTRLSTDGEVLKPVFPIWLKQVMR